MEKIKGFSLLGLGGLAYLSTTLFRNPNPMPLGDFQAQSPQLSALPHTPEPNFKTSRHLPGRCFPLLSRAEGQKVLDPLFPVSA